MHRCSSGIVVAVLLPLCSKLIYSIRKERPPVVRTTYIFSAYCLRMCYAYGIQYNSSNKNACVSIVAQSFSKLARSSLAIRSLKIVGLRFYKAVPYAFTRLAWLRSRYAALHLFRTQQHSWGNFNFDWNACTLFRGSIYFAAAAAGMLWHIHKRITRNSYKIRLFSIKCLFVAADWRHI